MAGTPKSYLDLAWECDGLPYPDQVKEYTLLTSTSYRFCLRKSWDDELSGLVTIGYILPSVMATMPWSSKVRVDHDDKTVTIPYAPGTDVETTAIREQLESARQNSSFDILRKWREELYQALGVNRDVRMARGGVALFGIHTVGVHMMAFCRTLPAGEMRLWIPRRAASKQTYPGMLDDTVGGAIAAGEDQFECMVGSRSGGGSVVAGGFDEKVCETCLLRPATRYLYDVELGANVVPKAKDGEVEEFHPWGVEETVGALKGGQFRPNSAVAWIDFLIRHGFIDAQNEPDYLQLVSKIHRRIHF